LPHGILMSDFFASLNGSACIERSEKSTALYFKHPVRILPFYRQTSPVFPDEAKGNVLCRNRCGRFIHIDDLFIYRGWRWGVGTALPQPQALQDLLNARIILDKGDVFASLNASTAPHGVLALGTDQRVNFVDFPDQFCPY